MDDPVTKNISIRGSKPTKKPYQYQPFPHVIRILRLYPGKANEPLIGELEFFALSNAPKYEAISYVWGTTSRSAEIICDGCSLPLTESLHDALQRVRCESRGRLIWADQVCINQDDLHERNRQVMAMNEIYKNAQQVLVWLGCDEHRCAKDVVALLESLEARFRDNERCGQLTADQQEQQLHWFSDDLWRQLATLYSLSWFRRMWILQEIGTEAAAILFWGDEEIRWAQLYHVSNILKEQYHSFSKRMKLRPERVTYLHRRFVNDSSRSDSEPTSFLWEQHRARHLDATDPRDRVFALLGHYSLQSGPGDLSDIVADYSQSAEQIYREVAIRSLTHVPTLEALNVVQHDRNPTVSPNGPPSWVSDWDHVSWAHMIGHPHSIFKAAGKSAPKLKFSQDRKLLIINGLQLDSIQKTSRVFYPSDFQVDEPSSVIVADLWRNICENVSFNAAKDYVSGGSAIAAFLDTLTVCRERTTYGQDHKTSLANGLSYIVRALRDYSKVDISEELRALANDGDYYHWIRSVSSAYTRKFGSTSYGYYILGPKLMKKGDIVAVFFGGKTPFCLRKQGSQYLLIGECYVHGLMDGEAMDLMEHREVSEKTFNIQ